jgi:hypothetical protein
MGSEGGGLAGPVALLFVRVPPGVGLSGALFSAGPVKGGFTDL